MAIAGYRLAVGEVACLSDEASVSRWLSPDLIACAPVGLHRPVWFAGRVLLARLLDNGPLPLLASGKQGKPWHPQLPDFNLSNSGQQVAVLLGKQPVGCDLERLRRRQHWQALARHCFSPALCRWLEALPVAAQMEAFWRLWTAHEAVLKQRGASVWQISELALPPETLCPPGLWLTHIKFGDFLIACCGTQPFPAGFGPESIIARGNAGKRRRKL